MNPINTSVAGTSVPPRSPRAPRSPMVQPRFSPREGRSYQLSVQTYNKSAENGQLTNTGAPNKSKQKGQETRRKEEKGQSGNQAKKKVKGCLIM